MTFAIFGMLPFVLGGWFAMIPFVKASLGLSKAELALTLLAMPMAVIPTLQIASWVISHFGPRRVPVGATNAGIAVTLYSTSRAAGRFAGDSLKLRLGAVGLARLTVGLAIVEFLILVLRLPMMSV